MPPAANNLSSALTVIHRDSFGSIFLMDFSFTLGLSIILLWSRFDKMYIMDDFNKSKKVSAECVLCGDKFEPDGRRKSRCSKMHYRDCKQCGQSFVITANMKVETLYCSKVCSGVSRARKTECPVCGEFFSKRSKTCSKECALELRRQTIEGQPLERTCAHCGKDFLALNGGAKYCKNTHTNTCKVCEKDFEVEAGSTVAACSTECRGVLINSEEAKEKKRKLSQERFGTDSPFQAEEVKGKIKETNLERYGFESHLSAPEIRDKIEKTNFERYGSSYFNGSEEGKAALIAKSLATYGVPNPFMAEEIKKKARLTLNRNIAIGNHRKYPRVSKINQRFAKEIENKLKASVSFESSFDRFFADLEVSINNSSYLVDINPTISHNSERSFICTIGGCPQPCVKHSVPSTTYHQNRALAAMDRGVKLIQWYDWNGGPEKLVDYLAPKLMPAKKFSARKLILRNLSSKVTNEFLARFHIQGASRSQSYRYGLFDGNELVAVATFGKSRFGAKEDFEFLRYAVASGYVVYGGAGSLLKRFIEEVGSGSIISYVDLDHTTAENTFLHTVGFTEKSVSSPGLIWYNPKSGKSIRGSSLIMQGADRLLGTSYGSREESGFGNKEIMLLEGFLPVNTSGNRIFSLSF